MRKTFFGKTDFDNCILKYKNSIDAGLLKILSKMGISVISSYRGGCNFEAVGLSRAIVSDYFPGMSSRISGIGISGIEEKIKKLHEKFSKRTFILCLSEVYIGIEKVVKITNIKETLYIFFKTQ